MDPYFPEFLFGARILRCDLIPIFLRHVEQTFLDENFETHNPIVTDSFNKASDPLAPPFFDSLLGFSSASTCRK